MADNAVRLPSGERTTDQDGVIAAEDEWWFITQLGNDVVDGRVEGVVAMCLMTDLCSVIMEEFIEGVRYGDTDKL